MKILAFAASNSSKSINRKLVNYASSIIKEAEVDEVETIDINDYEMPIYSSDREEKNGIPDLAHAFYKKIGEADALLISYAEHNASYTAAYKNLYDWTSRIDPKVFQGKPMVIMATSPGPGGAKNVLERAKTSAPYFGGEVLADLSLAKFYDNFDMECGKVIDEEFNAKLSDALLKLASIK